MNRIEAKAKLEAAIDDYVSAVSEVDGIVTTDYILNVSAVSLHGSVQAHYYFGESRGAMHALMGLTQMRSEELSSLNREEAELDNN